MHSDFRTKIGDSDIFQRLTETHRHPLCELDSLARVVCYDVDEPICNESRCFEYWYRITSGAARRCVSGQTIDIILPGDYFGFCVDTHQDLMVEAAAEDTVVLLYPRWCVAFLDEIDPTGRQALADLELDAVAQMQVHLSLGPLMMTTAVRINSFLLDMSRRVSADDAFVFELSTAEIANYPEITAEQLERHLTLLREQGAIAQLNARSVCILDPIPVFAAPQSTARPSTCPPEASLFSPRDHFTTPSAQPSISKERLLH
jgi:CRP/FNR family nitrogen fixation transcriptional regulator